MGATCSGKTIVVGAGGTAQISIPNTDADPMVAIHAEVSVTRQKFKVLQFISKPLFISLHFLVYALKFLVLAQRHSIKLNKQFAISKFVFAAQSSSFLLPSSCSCSSRGKVSQNCRLDAETQNTLIHLSMSWLTTQ